MHKVSRSLLLAGVLAFGTLTAACGDKVTVAPPTQGITGIQSITVTPPAASVAVGSSVQLAVSVVADAATAKTVTWTSSNAAVATVDQTGKVTGVAAGSASIIATATADATKASASAITVTGGTPTGTAGIAISSVTAGNTLTPVNLANVANQIDVTLFVSGPASTVRLIQNCTAGGGTSATGDVIVGQQNFAGSQNQTPIVISYNTAATGSVVAGVAVVDNTVSTPIQVNGNCFLKAALVSGTTVLATAANITPFTLNNGNFLRSTLAYTKTTPVAFSAAQNAISATNGLRYDQGDLTVTVSPVIYSTTGTAAQVPALGTFFLSGAGKTVSSLTPTAGKFTATFPSVASSSNGGSNIAEYTTTATGGDVITATMSDAAGNQIIFVGTANVANQTCSNSVNCTPVPIRIDNQSPTSGGPLAEVLNKFTNQRNYINGAYTFAATGASGNFTPQTDIAFAASQLTPQFWVGSLPASPSFANAPALSAQTIIETNSGCSTTGLTKVATGADIPQTTAPFTPNLFVRVIEIDPVGNAVCQDFGITNGIAGFGVDLQAPTAPAITGGTNGVTAAGNVVVTTGASVTYNSVDSVSGFNPGAELRTTVVRNFVTTSNSNSECVVGAFASSTCGPVSTGFTVVLDPVLPGTQAYYTITTNARDQAGNLSGATVRTYLMDVTPPVVAGVSIPQNLVGGSSVTFQSTATDNVDLQVSNFSLLYSAITGASLFYQGDNYGPNYDATRITSAPLNATVPFFIKQLQQTAAGAPVAFAGGIGADSGRAQSVTIRAIDAANLVSAPSAALIPALNIANSTGFTAGVQLNTWNVTTAAVNVSNPTPPTAPATTTTSAVLTAAAVFNGATAQQQNLPFAQVCFFYQNSAAVAPGQPIPLNDLVSLGCVTNPGITDVANTSRTWTYTLGAPFDPPAILGTAGNVSIFAVGINTAGVGLLSGANTAITLVP